MALGWVALRGSKRLPDAIARYSTLALWAIAVVGVSGVANASVRLVGWGDIFGSSYGRLVVAKVVALVLLAVLGWRQRRRIVAQGQGFLTPGGQRAPAHDRDDRRWPSPSRARRPRSSDVVTTRAEELLGGPMPAAPTLATPGLGLGADRRRARGGRPRPRPST